jgi:hypothetical protein
MNISEWEPSFYCSSEGVVEKPAQISTFTRGVRRIRIWRCRESSKGVPDQMVLEKTELQRKCVAMTTTFWLEIR